MKQTALLFVLALAVLLVAIALVRRDEVPTSVVSDKLLEGFQPEKVARVRILGPDGEVNLRLGEEGWEVEERGNYRSDSERVVGLIRRAWDLKPVQELTVSPEQHARLQVVPPGTEGASEAALATLVEFADEEGNVLGGFLLGKRQTRDAQGGMPGMPGVSVGRYVRATGDTETVSLVSETFDDAAPTPSLWLDRDFIRIAEPVRIELDGGTPERTWVLNREDGIWTAEGKKPEDAPDPNKVFSIKSAWQMPSFTDVSVAEAEDESAFEVVGTAKLLTNDGLLYTLEFAEGDGASVPMRIAVEDAVVESADEETSAAEPADAPEEAEDTETAQEEDSDDAEQQRKGEAEAKAMERERREEALQAAKAFEGTIYLIPSFTADSLLRDYESLKPDPEPEPEVEE